MSVKIKYIKCNLNAKIDTRNKPEIMKKAIVKWTVQGYYPNVPLFGFSELHGITQ